MREIPFTRFFGKAFASGIKTPEDTLSVIDFPRQKAGANTIAISSFAHSLPAKESDCRLIAFSDDKNYPVEAVSERIAYMCMLDVLMMTLAAQKLRGPSRAH